MVVVVVGGGGEGRLSLMQLNAVVRRGSAVAFIGITATLVKRSPAGHWALLGLTALIISPLGYLLTRSLTDLADKAAASLFLAV